MFVDACFVFERQGTRYNRQGAINVSIFETERKTSFRRYTTDKELLFATIRTADIKQTARRGHPEPGYASFVENYMERLSERFRNVAALALSFKMTPTADGKMKLQLSGFVIVSTFFEIPKSYSVSYFALILHTIDPTNT